MAEVARTAVNAGIPGYLLMWAFMGTLDPAALFTILLGYGLLTHDGQLDR